MLRSMPTTANEAWGPVSLDLPATVLSEHGLVLLRTVGGFSGLESAAPVFTNMTDLLTSSLS